MVKYIMHKIVGPEYHECSDTIGLELDSGHIIYNIRGWWESDRDESIYFVPVFDGDNRILGFIAETVLFEEEECEILFEKEEIII